MLPTPRRRVTAAGLKPAAPKIGAGSPRRVGPEYDVPPPVMPDAVYHFGLAIGAVHEERREQACRPW